jgi:hypothetical protein
LQIVCLTRSREAAKGNAQAAGDWCDGLSGSLFYILWSAFYGMDAIVPSFPFHGGAGRLEISGQWIDC